MQALPSVRGQEAETVKALAKFVKDNSDRHAAGAGAAAASRRRLWPAEQVEAGAG